jgi:hypothetical protein
MDDTVLRSNYAVYINHHPRGDYAHACGELGRHHGRDPRRTLYGLRKTPAGRQASWLCCRPSLSTTWCDKPFVLVSVPTTACICTLPWVLGVLRPPDLTNPWCVNVEGITQKCPWGRAGCLE